MWGLERTEKKDFQMVRVSQCYTLLTVFKEQTFKGQKGKKKKV